MRGGQSVNSKSLKLMLAASSCLAGASPVIAQSAERASAASSAPVDQTGSAGTDIVVTAQRRNERYVDVPTSVSVVSANQLPEAEIGRAHVGTPGTNAAH